MNNLTGFADLVGDTSIMLGLVVADKAGLLQALAEKAASATGQPVTTILERVRERETLGATGFGQGAAIPHARLAGLEAVTAVVARLVRGVEYGAIDGEAVDVAVLLVSPEDAGADHLKALARVSRALRDHDVLGAIRDAEDVAGLRRAIGSDATPGQRAA